MPPPGSWDTHFHVFDTTDTANPDAVYSLFDAPMAALDQMHRTIGIDRGVLVQATSITPDHSRLIAHLRSNPRLMGIANISDETSDAVLGELDSAGVRGGRFHFAAFVKKRPEMNMFHRSVARMAEIGWHVLVHVEMSDLIELAPMLKMLPIPVVIDHVAHLRIRDGMQSPGFQTLLELNSHDNIWIKMSDGDRWSDAGAPSYADFVPFAREIIASGSERLLWGTDWPHVLYKTPTNLSDAPPDAGHLMNLLFAFTDNDASIVNRLLVQNPRKLYDGPLTLGR
jgi:2-pyrone-4,6-dicarboxylate lactonase